jgi:hypothetical protein
VTVPVTDLRPEFQPTLFDDVTVVIPANPTAEERFAAFRQRHPWFLSRLASMAAERKAAGATRVSMKALFEQLRGEMGPSGDGYSLDNSYTPYAARLLMERWPELDGLFVTRRAKADKQ